MQFMKLHIAKEIHFVFKGYISFTIETALECRVSANCPKQVISSVRFFVARDECTCTHITQLFMYDKISCQSLNELCKSRRFRPSNKLSVHKAIFKA